MAFDLSSFENSKATAELADQVIEHFQSSQQTGEQVRYPGQHVLEMRRENMAKGIPVQPSIWKELQQL